ncbi:MAG: biotin--[acetyl-CoA-carboxylase] ligase [Anaerolineae bacterium]|nr:biotin--[acetyl-CoA-carboxylase] ligase [Anaerolineae bacterium]
MDLEKIKAALEGLPIGEIGFFPTIGSTNDLAGEWAGEGAPDFSLVVADEQTRGRGRGGKHWHTPAESALAMSILLRPSADEQQPPAFYTGLASLAVCQTLIESFRLDAAIKWPNDVLIEGKKTCGVLVETQWLGERPAAVIVGVGINVAASSIPNDTDLNFPATSVESAWGKPVDRLQLLREVIKNCLFWRARLHSPEFLEAWRSWLAYRDQRVHAQMEGQPDLIGIVRGLDESAHLMLESEDGQIHHLHSGEIHLRPFVDTSPN